jgi:hypothetical protein
LSDAAGILDHLPPHRALGCNNKGELFSAGYPKAVSWFVKLSHSPHEAVDYPQRHHQPVFMPRFGEQSIGAVLQQQSPSIRDLPVPGQAGFTVKTDGIPKMVVVTQRAKAESCA